MGWIFYNPNPYSNLVGDCTVRALTLALNSDWRSIYIRLVVEGYSLGDMPSANEVWGSLLRKEGFERKIIPNECPNCYTIRQFAEDNKKGIYILATGSHVVTVKDGSYYDTWDSGNEIPIYYWEKEDY